MSESSEKAKKDTESGVAEHESDQNEVTEAKSGAAEKLPSKSGPGGKQRSKSGTAEKPKSKSDKPKSGPGEANVTETQPSKSGTAEMKAPAPVKSKVTSGKSKALDEDDTGVEDDEDAGSPIKSDEVKSQVSGQRSAAAGGTKNRSQVCGRARSTQSGMGGGRKAGRSRSRGEAPDMGTVRIGFVGAGRMTEAITRGLLRSEKLSAKQLFVSSRSAKNFDEFKTQGIATSIRPYEIFAKLDCDVVFLCMHGFVVRNCFKMGGTRPFPFTTNYIPWKRKQTIILSLVGGIPIADIKVTLLNPEQTNKYNVIINRATLNAGVAYNLGYGCLDVELDSSKCPGMTRDLLQLLGRVEYLDGSLMDAACALAGNGMAFVFYYISALADGGFKMGIARDRAVKLACKTLQAAALSVLESNKPPMCLRDEATGPSGPAIYGLNVMDKKDFHGGVASAVEACFHRILELAENDCIKKATTVSV